MRLLGGGGSLLYDLTLATPPRFGPLKPSSLSSELKSAAFCNKIHTKPSIPLTYEDRLQATDLLPISFWHEYLDLTFLFKMFNGLVCVSEEIIPERKHGNIRTTRATSNSDIITFRIRKCRTVIFQGSFMNRSNSKSLEHSSCRTEIPVSHFTTI